MNQDLVWGLGPSGLPDVSRLLNNGQGPIFLLISIGLYWASKQAHLNSLRASKGSQILSSAYRVSREPIKRSVRETPFALRGSVSRVG